MTHRLTTDCAKNYCNWTLIVKVIVENVVTCFLWDTVYIDYVDISGRYSARGLQSEYSVRKWRFCIKE